MVNNTGLSPLPHEGGGKHLHSLTAEGGTEDGVLRPLGLAKPSLAEALQHPKNFALCAFLNPEKRTG